MRNSYSIKHSESPREARAYFASTAISEGHGSAPEIFGKPILTILHASLGDFANHRQQPRFADAVLAQFPDHDAG